MNNSMKFYEILLEFLGIFTSRNKYLPSFVKNILLITILITFFMTGLSHMIQSLDNFDDVAEELSILLLGMIGMFRFATLIYNKKNMNDLRNAVHENTVRGDKQLTNDDNRIIDKYDNDGLRCGKIYGILIFVSTQGMILQTLPGWYLGHGLRLPFPATYPFNLNSTVTFTIAFVHQATCTNLFLIVFLAFDSWFIFLVFHACGHYSLLQNCLEKIEEFDEQDDVNKIHKTISNFVELHENVFKFSGKIENAFNKSHLMQNIFGSLSICIGGYQVVTIGFQKPQLMVKHLASIFEQTLLSFIFNWCGDLVEDESFGVSLAVSRSKMYKLDVKHQRDLSLIMLRAQKPMYMTVGTFFNLSLESFSNYLKTTMSYFTVLTSMQDTEISILQ